MTKKEAVKKLVIISECISDVSEELELDNLEEDDFVTYAMSLDLYIYELKRVLDWVKSNY